MGVILRRSGDDFLIVLALVWENNFAFTDRVKIRIFRYLELERQSGRTIQIPEYVYERIKDAEESIANGDFITFEELEARLGIIRYGKRGIAYYKFRNKRRKAVY